MFSIFAFAAWLLMLVSSGGVFCSRGTLQKSLFFQNPTSGSADKIQAASGGSVVLECEAGGNPTPLIRWIRNGRQIVQGVNGLFDDLESLTYSQRRKTNDLKGVLLSKDNLEENEVVPKFDLGLTKSRLFLDCVSASDAGSYTCVAETVAKKISTDFQLSVGRASSDSAAEGSCRKKRSVQDDVGAAARIYLWTMHRVVVEGSDLQLFCRAFGNPVPVITWYDPNNNPIDNETNGQYEVLPNGDLLVRNTNWMHNMGLYRCVAENENGSDEVSTFVYPTAAEKSS